MRTDLSSISKISRVLVTGLILIVSVIASLTQAGAQDFTAQFKADYGNVTVMEVTGNFDSENPDGSGNDAPRKKIANEFFRTHKDEYDFVTFFTNFDYQLPKNAAAFYSPVKNDVQGIGQQVNDNSSFYGSNGKLQGTIDMWNLLKLATNPLDPNFNFTVDALVHETLHRWGAYVKFKDWNNVASDSILGYQKAHWSFLFDSGGSTHLGNKWRDNGDGTFTSTAVRKYYSPLDLYLMGMIDKSKVPPTLLIENPAIDPAKISELGATISGTARSVTVDDIIAVEGERIPNVKDSQKQFKTAFIYIVTPGTFKADDLPALENLRNAYLTRFSILTDGKGLVQVTSTLREDLPTNPGVTPPPLVSHTLPLTIDNGITWLMNHQQIDGSWTDYALTTERDTAESVTTLQHFPIAAQSFQTGFAWLGNNASANTDYLARRIEAAVQAKSNSSALVQELLARRNRDGGWGSNRNFTSSATDTALALKALAVTGYIDSSVTGPAITYLQSSQNGDGGWCGEDAFSTIQPTAAVMTAFNFYRKSTDLESNLTKAVTFLASKQDPDPDGGGFGNSPSTVYDSALAVIALQSVGADKTMAGRGVSYLLRQQSDNGAWFDSPFQTALAVRAVWSATVDPDLSIKPEDITVIPTAVTTIPTNAVLSTIIWNLGRSDVPQAKVAVYDGIVTPEKKVAEQIVAFLGQSQVALTFSIPVTDSAGHVFHVVVDPDNRVGESDKNNNRASKTLLPEITYDFQVLGSDLTASPNPVDAGNDVKIAVKVSNRGTSDAYNVPVRIFIDQLGTPVEIAQVMVDIPSGGSVSREITWRANLAGVNLPLTVQVDPNNTFTETSKDNNKASAPLTVNASTLPNLSVSYKDMVISPNPAREGGSVYISPLVKNDGFSKVENVKVNIYKGLASNGGTLLGTSTIPVIGAGQSVPVTIEWKGIAENGERLISAQVASENSIQEISNDDNLTFTTLDILSLPDLAISDSSIVINPATPKAGDTVSVAITVQNAGDQEVHDVTVQLKEGGAVIGSTVIPLINGNSQASGAINYSNSTQTGSHRVTVVVDPDNAIVESSKENNSAVKTFIIQDANLWLSEPYISPNGDSIKDATDFSFRLTAPIKVSVQVVNKKGVAVRTFGGGELDNTAGTTITWDGKNDAGSVVDDGTYQIRVIGANTALLASLPVEVDTNRSPLSEALGTKYLLQNNQTCQLPNYSELKWLPDDSGLIFRIYPDANSIYPDGIYSMSPIGDDILRLIPNEWNSTSNPELTYTLSTQDLSPDGQRVVFNRTKTTRTFLGYFYDWWSGYYAKYDYYYANSLWMVSSDGSNLTQLTDERVSVNINNSYYIILKWSPDGKRIGIADTSGLRVLNPETKVISSPISKGTQNVSSLSWSLDGTKLLASFYNSGGFAVSDNNGIGGFLSLTANLNNAWVNGWMNGNKILMSMYDTSENNYKSLLLDPADGSTMVVNVDNYTSPNIIISPDHNNVALIRDRNWNAELTSISIFDRSGKSTVVAEQQPDANAPVCGECNNLTGVWGSTWSQDGSQLAYISTHYDETEHKFHDDLVIYDMVSGSSQRLALADYYSEDGYVDSVTWMKDRSSLLVKTVEGTFLFKLSDGSRSDLLPIGMANFFELSPTERYLTYEQYGDPDTGCFPKWNNQWAISSLLNLTADLRITKNKTVIKLSGIASDKNFAGYQLEYSDKKTPDSWNLILPPSDIPVLSDKFIDWVPPNEGSFHVKLTTWDKAGNMATVRKRVSWGVSTLVSSLYRDNEIIAPNNPDNLKKTALLHYTALDAVHLEFTIVNDKGDTVRSYSRDHAGFAVDSISWDGRDENGNFVPDGKYTIKLFDYEFGVEVDNTPPKVTIGFSAISYDSKKSTYSANLTATSEDARIKNWTIQVGTGENPQDWSLFASGTGNSYYDIVYDVNIAFYKFKRFRIIAEDYAGNQSIAISPFVESKVFFTSISIDGFGGSVPTNGISFKMKKGGEYLLNGFESVSATTQKVILQFSDGTFWKDIQEQTSGGNISFLWQHPDNITKPYGLRFKAVTVSGSEYFSQIIQVNEDFSGKFTCDGGLVGFNYLFESLQKLSVSVTSSTGKSISSTFEGSSVPLGGFSLPIPVEKEIPDGYLINMVGTGVNGGNYNFNERFDSKCGPPGGKVILGGGGGGDGWSWGGGSGSGSGPVFAVIYPDALACGKNSGEIQLPTERLSLAGVKRVAYLVKDGSFQQVIGEVDVEFEGARRISIDSSLLPMGRYPLSVIVTNMDNTQRQTDLGMVIVFDTEAPKTQLTLPASPCPVRTVTSGGTRLGFEINAVVTDNISVARYALYYGIGENPSSWLPAMSVANDGVTMKEITGSGAISGRIGIWDISDISGSVFTLKLEVTDSAGNKGCSIGVVKVDREIQIKGYNISPLIFSPNADGNLDKATASFSLDEPATADLSVFTISKDINGSDVLGSLQRHVQTGSKLNGGAATFDWDGKGDSGSTLSDNRYGVSLTVTDVCGNTASQWKAVELDNSQPTTSIDYPLPGNPLPPGVMIEIKGTATDPHFKSYLLEVGEGDTPVTWRALATSDKPLTNAVIATWNTFGLKDHWTLRLTAEDIVGNKKVATSTIDLGIRKELIKSLDATPKLFSPNNDQKLESSLITYEVTDACNLKIDIMDGNGQVARTFTAVTAGAGKGSIDWDGKNSLVNYVPDGIYTIRLVASLTAKPEVSQTETITLTVDTTPPAITLTDLTEKSYLNRTDLTISGTVNDANLVGYNITIVGPSGTSALDTGTQNRANYTFGRITDLSEDTYTVTVDANDLGQNQGKLVRTFTIDRTPPKAVLNTPKSGEFYGNTKNTIDISGSIVEKNLDRYSLRYGVGETPTDWMEVVGGVAVPTASKLSSLKVGKTDGIADGIYILSLYAKDKAGLEGETKVKIIIDNTPPQVAITSPIDAAYVTKPLDIKGTVADTYFDNGTMELATGSCASAIKWSVIKTLNATVQDGILDSWKVLPADGEYCLRLSAADKSGNKSEVKIGFKIDTHPPAAPQLTGKIDNKVDAVLVWVRSPESDLAGYNIYRNNQKIGTALLSDISFRDPVLKEGSYTYTVRAMDLAGNESAPSNAVTLKVDLTGPTVRITTPRDGATVSNLVDVKGTAHSQDDFKEYRVYIGQGSSPSNWSLIRRSPLPISYGSLAQWDTIAGLEGSQYSIKLEGEDTFGNISSTQAIVTIDNTPPRAPVLDPVIAPTSNNVTLTWQANAPAEGVIGYLLYRNDQLANVTGIVAGNLQPYLLTGTTYSDRTLPDGTYSYYLVAMDQAGNSSDQSDPLRVVTIDTRPPHMTITTPTNGHKFDGVLMINAETPDNDIATVQFQYKRSIDVGWTNLGTPLTKYPFITYFNPKSLGLAYDDYQVQALAVDKGGKSDPAPPLVTITYADLTPPDVPSGLAAKVLGAEVNLTWDAVSEAEASYNIYRWNAGSRVKINGTAVKTLLFTDSAVPDGTYQYEVTATDVSGNESAASKQVTAKIFAPIITQPFTPVKESALNLTGKGVDPNAIVEITTVQPSGDTAKVMVTADASGNFKLEGITLGFGETSFTAVTTDSNGNISKLSEMIYVALGKVPAAPTGLTSSVQVNDVTLNWNANSEPDLGYYIYRDGVRLNNGYWVQPAQVSASIEDTPATDANDDVSYTYWSNAYSSDGTFSPVWWQMTLPEPEVINELDLNWLTDWDYNGNQILYAGKDFEVQAWSGHNWVTIKKVTGNDQQYNELTIDPPYRTDRLRLVITSTTDPNVSKQVKLAEAYAYADDIISSPTYLDNSVSDGKHHYEVSAINQYAFVSGKAATDAKVGPFPQTPTGLTATAQGSDVALNWNPNSASDSVSYYNLERWNGEVLESSWWVNADPTTYTDPGIANGSYRYRVSAQALGNNGWLASDFSDYVNVTVAVTPPAALTTGLNVSSPLVGKALDINWQMVPDASGYKLYHSVTSGGPYFAVQSWLNSAPYRDGGLVDGTSYYYVMTVLDSFGNESVYSAEATGIPRDLIAQQPLVFKPTVPGIPVTTSNDAAEVAGFAEPGAHLDIKRNEVTIAAATASLLEQQNDKPLALDTDLVSLSPDRSLLASVANNAFKLTDLSSNAVTVTLDLPFANSWGTPRWSPSGRFLLFSGSDSNWNNKIATFDRETQQVQIIATGVSANEFDASWSPTTDNFVFVSADDYDNRVLWLGNPIDGSVTRLADANYADDPRLSHDNKYVAYFEDNETLLLLNRVDGTVTTVDSNTDGGSLAWSPDDSKLAYISYQDGDGDINSYTLSSREIVRRTFSEEDGGRLAWSPDGSRLGYKLWPDDDELFSVVDENGSEQIVFTAEGDLYGIPEWRSDGDIIAFDQLGLHTIKLAGYFSSNVTGLTAGENRLTAVATDPAGNVSIPSEAITLVYDSGALPDLTITDSDIIFFPPVSKPGEETLVTVRVRNLAGNAVDNAKVDLYLWDGANDVTTLASETISHIDAYGEGSIAVRFNVGTANGTRAVIAVADPSDTINEVLETNNYASKDLVITNLEGVRLTTSLNSLRYTSNQELSARISLLNSGLPTSGVLTAIIEDASGAVVKQLTGQSLELAYGQKESLPFTWNTGVTFAGSYRLHSLLKNGATVLVEDSVAFTIVPDLTFTTRITTDRQQYGANQQVGISANFTNAGLNYLIPQLKANVRIFDAQNTQLFSGEQSVANIMPGMSVAQDFTWNSGLNAPGDFTATVEYSVGDQIAGNASTVFSIIPVASITGSLKAASNVVQPGEAIAVSYILTNSGNSAATGQALLTLVDPDSLSVITTMEQTVSIPMGGTQSGSTVFASGNLLLKPYLVTLTYVSLGSRTSVGTVPVSIKDGIPPVLTVVSPASGEQFAGDVSFSVLASDNASGVARVEYSRDGGTWSILPPTDQAAGRYGFAWTPVAAESGAHSVSFRGADRAGNTSSPLVVPFVIYIDTTPPTGCVVINGGAGVTPSNQVMLSLTASDPSGVSQMRFSNDGSVWSNPEKFASTRGWFLATGDGLKRVSVSYQDMAGNWSVAPIVADIVLDTIPPTVSASPGGGVYNAAQSVTLVANESAVIRYTVDGSAPVSTSAVYQAPIQIASDTTLRFMASDSVGNLGDSITESYTIDILPPSLTVSTLADGSYTNNLVLNIAGMATDSSGIVSLALNGANVPQNQDGSFSQALLLQPGANTVTVVATDLVGNNSTDSRTINLDTTAPLLTIATPADNAKTASDVMNVTGTVDESSTVLVKLGTSVQQVATNGAGFSASVGLIPGINTIDITATDVAGNTSTQKRTVIYDDQNPSLAITDPPQDIRTNQSGLILRGTVSDLYTQVGVTATMDVQSYTPPVVGGAFEQQLSFTQEKSYAIVVTATNEVGSSVTTQRNVIYDITPPTLAINPVQSPTTANSVLISGTRETDVAVAVTVTCSTATVGTIVYPTASSWEVQLSAMPLGEHIVTAQATDTANNISTATAGIIVQQSGSNIVLTPSPTILWPPNHKMVPVTISGMLNVPVADIKSLKISLSDEYGEYNFTNLKLGSTVSLEAWRNGNDPDGRKYTFTAVLTRNNGSKMTATAVVLVPHDMSGSGAGDENTHEGDGDDDKSSCEENHEGDDHDAGGRQE